MELIIDSKKHGIITVFYDEVDDELVRSHTWAVTRIANLYVLTSIKTSKGVWTKQYLHRMITNAPKGKVVDHIDRNTLNNMRSNLRVCSQSLNTLNQYCVGQSGFPNVNKVGRRFRSSITFEGKHFHGGYFDTPEEAHAKAVSMKEEIYENFRKLTGHK
jgi:hypothetical protein